MKESKGQIAFQQIGIGGILKQYRLAIPPNQREYSWDAEVTTLLTDLAKAMSDEEGEYFLGTIVTIPRSPAVLEVVDGQQRLATTAILLAQIRNYLGKNEPLIAEYIENGFLTEIDPEKRVRVVKLQLNLDDNEFFRAMMKTLPGGTLPEPTKTSHGLIKGAFDKTYAHIGHIVSSFNQKDHGDVLNKWIEFIEYGAQVILLKVPTNVNAYKMFETLNDRGLKTSQADLVKNYLFGQAGDRLPEAQQKWALMRGALESLEEEDITITFLRHALIAIRGFVREEDVFEAVQGLAKGPDTSINFLANLEKLANVYVAIFNPEHEKWNPYPDSMHRALHTLNFLNIRPFRPLMLAVAATFPPKEATEAFQMFIAWEVRFLITGGTRTGSVETALSIEANKVFSGDKTTGVKTIEASALKKDLKNMIPNDERFRQDFELATVSKAAIARYYLRSLQMAANGEPSPWFIPNEDKEVINLEHILPFHFEGSKWPKFDEESGKVYARRIGNQALLLAKTNSDLKSSDFEAKKVVYKDSPFSLTNQLATVSEDWSPSLISLRQKKLAELALRAWPV